MYFEGKSGKITIAWTTYVTKCLNILTDDLKIIQNNTTLNQTKSIQIVNGKPKMAGNVQGKVGFDPRTLDTEPSAVQTAIGVTKVSGTETFEE